MRNRPARASSCSGPDALCCQSEQIGNTQRPNGQGPNKDTLEEGAIVSDQATAAGMPCVDRVKSRLGRQWVHVGCAPSLHPGGVNVSYLDGHVCFLENNVDEIVMALAVSVTDE